MRKLIIATAALAFISSSALAQDKAGAAGTPGATSGDTSTMSKDTMKKTKKTKKTAAKKTGDDATKQ